MTNDGHDASSDIYQQMIALNTEALRTHGPNPTFSALVYATTVTLKVIYRLMAEAGYDKGEAKVREDFHQAVVDLSDGRANFIPARN